LNIERPTLKKVLRAHLIARESTRTHLKKAFWPKLGVGREYQILEILKYSSGLIYRGRLDFEPKSVF